MVKNTKYFLALLAMLKSFNVNYIGLYLISKLIRYNPI